MTAAKDGETRSLVEDKANLFSSVSTKKLLCIEYPGFIKNVDKMLATLGGEKTIGKTYFQGKCRLQMTYRPEDITAHYACADLVPCTGLLMKVRRRRKPSPAQGAGAEKRQGSLDSLDATPEKYEYQQEIVGIVKDQYRFQTPIDFQYLTPKEMCKFFSEIHGSEVAEQVFPPHIIPPVFARVDTVGQYNYRPDFSVRPPNSTQGSDVHSVNLSSSQSSALPRKKRQTESMAALFETKEIPLAPSDGALALIDSMEGRPDAEAINIGRRLFEERPIWSRLALSCHIAATGEKLKRILQCFAYYWLSGPWRTLWCRMGYDPRKDPSAKIYQMLDFRIRESVKSKVDYSLLIPKRSARNFIPRHLASRGQFHGSSIMVASAEVSCDKPNLAPLPYVFTRTAMLASRNMMFQLCDLQEPELQKIIHENDGQEVLCDERDGWFPAGTIPRIRSLMVTYVNELLTKETSKKFAAGSVVKQENSRVDNDSVNSFPSQFSLADPAVDMEAGENSFSSSGFQTGSYVRLLQGDDDDDDFDMDSFTEYGPEEALADEDID